MGFFNSSQKNTGNQELLDRVLDDFKAAKALTQESFLQRLKQPSTKNWYVIFGFSNSGKSTLLSTAVNNKNFNVQKNTSTLCEYWHAENAVFVNISSEAFLNNNNEAQDNVNVLNLLFEKFKKSSILPSGIIVTAAIPEIQNQQALYDSQASFICGNIERLNNLFPGISISIVTTKSDLIAGFNEFFDDMRAEERDKSCGIQFPAPPYKNNLPKLCDEAFSKLLQRFNDRLLWRIHQEPDLQKKHLIKDFPTQVELLKPHLGYLLNQILPSIEITLNGIYFVSAIQHNSPINNMEKPLKDIFDLHPTVNVPQLSSKDYFIKGLFHDLINAKQFVYIPKSNSWITYTSSFLAIAFIAAGAYFYQNYQANQNNLKAANMLLQHAGNNLGTKPFQNTIAKLYALQQTYNALKESHQSLTQSEKNHHELLIREAQQSFWTLLQQQFFLELSNTLDNELTKQIHASQIDYLSVFDTLATYFRFHDPAEFDQQKIIGWYKNYWQKQNISITQKKLLNKYLELLTSRPLPQQKINFALMLQAQEVVKEKTPMKIAVDLLSQKINSHPIQLIESDVSLVLDNTSNTIPSLYTKANWSDVNQVINEVSQQVAQYLWTIDDNSVDAQSLAAKLQQEYAKHYIAQWQNVLSQLHYTPRERFNDYLVTLNLLNSTRSPLKQLLNKVQENTGEIPGDNQFNTLISAQFEAINQIHLNDPNSEFNKAIDQLSESMNAIGNAKNPIATAYARARLRVSHQSKSDALNAMYMAADALPQPIQQWSGQVADNAWQLILDGAKSYLNAIWTQFIIPEYENSIKNRFPVYTQAVEDIHFEDFARFFSTDGVMDTFYKNYLADFVDEDAGWTWKKVNGRAINISNKTLENFIRAMLIQKMFFTHSKDHPEIVFSMRQTALNPSVKEFSLLVDNQTIEYQTEPDKLTNITWPGAGVTDNQMRFINSTGKITKLDFNDDWGWLRVMQLAQIKPTNKTQKVIAVFKFAGQTIAQYEINSDGVINPYTPDVVNLFRCPPRL